MVAICLYFQVHQPNRLRNYTVFDMHQNHCYEDEKLNKEILQKIAAKCYLPTNAIIEQLIKQFNGRFNIAFSLSGTFVEQLEKFSPETLNSFKRLAATGCVEFLNETYNHSLSFIYSRTEFERQVRAHSELIQRVFNQKSITFRNTELIYNNALAQCVSQLGYKVILAEGADKVLLGRNPNFVYQPANISNLKLLLKNYQLSDDVAFRFSEPSWSEYPLTAHRYANWIHQMGNNAQVINLFMDYETFGEHQWEDKGIFDFLKALPEEILKDPNFIFATPSMVAQTNQIVDVIDSPEFYSWADNERDLTAWCGNELQQESLINLYALENAVYATEDPRLIQQWRSLQTSDHFYYMCIKWHADGDVHKYFSPYDNPFDAYINYQNVLNDFAQLVHQRVQEIAKNKQHLRAKRAMSL